LQRRRTSPAAACARQDNSPQATLESRVLPVTADRRMPHVGPVLRRPEPEPDPIERP
jgi:hypothetical protein